MKSAGETGGIQRARGWKIPGAITKNVLLDPGIVYTLADVLLFAGTNMVGFGAMAGAMGIAMGLKTLAVVQPSFLRKYPKLSRFAFDDRTPLRINSIALVIVGVAAVATGAFLPAAASFLFAMANFRLAESISRREKTIRHRDPAQKISVGEMAKVFFLRPEFYLNAGFVCAGLMAGGAALYVLPVVIAAFGIGMRNAMKEKPEHEGHPKLLTAAAAGAFAFIGYGNAHGLIAVAHAINAVVLVEMERRVTEGGHRAILKDLADRAISVPGEGIRVAGELSQHPVRWTQKVQQAALPPARQLSSAFRKIAAGNKPANQNEMPDKKKTQGPGL